MILFGLFPRILNELFIFPILSLDLIVNYQVPYKKDLPLTNNEKKKYKLLIICWATHTSKSEYLAIMEGPFQIFFLTHET